jgi:cruciform cutting endonuclease 1
MMPPNSIFPLFLTKKGPTVKAVQEVLQRIGEATAGTKDVVQTRLLTKVVCSKIPQTYWQDGEQKQKRSSRILSIDMGIKNLAYCVADVEQPTSAGGTTDMAFRVWRRLDLSEAFREYQGYQDGSLRSLAKEAVLEGRESEDVYSPENLSRMGYWFLRKVLDDWNPDVILIERQRWRSAGSPTIQQWTVRVNTLEAVMWAVVTAMKNERKKMFEWHMYAVDPKRVGHFWLDGVTPVPTLPRASKKKAPKPTTTSEEDKETIEEFEDQGVGGNKKLSRGKAEKKAKIQLLRTWLDSDHPSTTLSTPSKTDQAINPYPDISFTFDYRKPASYGADGTRQALLYATDPPSERAKRTRYYKAYVDKVDDITDCFLQAAAWVAWDENLRRLRPEVDEFSARVEEQLGRKLILRSHLVDAVKELQDSGAIAAIDEAKVEKVVKKASKGKKTKPSKTEEIETVDEAGETTT